MVMAMVMAMVMDMVTILITIIITIMVITTEELLRIMQAEGVHLLQGY